MILIVNGNKKSFRERINLTELLDHLDLQTDRKGLALCVNMQVIPKDNWESTDLHEGDKIEIVIAAPGG
jgi:sulfur carrier protein